MGYIAASAARIVPDTEEGAEEGGSSPDKFADLCSWVVERVEAWRTWRDSQYAAEWDEYERLWRGKWSSNERLRESERSRIVSPALGEAVENGCAEIEEATFGRGVDYFDISPFNLPREDAPVAPPMAPQMADMGGMPPEMGGGPPMAPPTPMKSPAQAARDAIEVVRTSLKEDLARTDFAAQVSKAILNAGVFGLGVGEVKGRKLAVKSPAVDPLTGVPGADVVEMDMNTLRSVSPRNFVYPDCCESLEDALGCAVEENVGLHLVRKAQKEGGFRPDSEVDLDDFAGQADPRLSGDQIGGKSTDLGDAMHQITYYGLVPTRFLYPITKDEETVELFPDDESTDSDEDDGEYTEAIVVIGNKQVVLKAEANPFMMGDRPIVIFPWDIVPGRLNGRGLCEKGANSQKVLDAEQRARLDSLALTTAPMVAMDANRMPRGFKFKVQPGASILTSGNPAEVMMPFKFGATDPQHYQNMQVLQSQVQQATGSVDAAAMTANMGNARPGAVSMSMAPIIKRYKRTMVHFLDLFLMPALEKITYRNMQTQPDRYPTVPLKFKAASTMGIMQREYETGQLTTLLSAMPPGTPEHRAVLTGIISNTSIPNREQVMELVAGAEQREAQAAADAQALQQDPMVAQLRQVSMQLEIREKESKIQKLDSEAALNMAKAHEVAQSAEVNAMEVATKGIYALPQEQQAAEFDRRYKMMQLSLQQADIEEKAKDRESNERIAHTQMAVSAATHERTKKLEKALEDAQNEDIEIHLDAKGRPIKARVKRKKPQGATSE